MAVKVHLAAGYASTAEASAPPATSPQEHTAQEMSMTAEIACALTVSERSAGTLLSEAVPLTAGVPLTLAALRAGRMSWQHARVVCDETSGLEPAAAAAFESHFLNPDAPNPARGCRADVAASLLLGGVPAGDVPLPAAQVLVTVPVFSLLPGCNNHSLNNDTDHLLAWADGGTTGITNLGQPCRRHHRLKHTTAWRPVEATVHKPPGWISPAGRTYPSEQCDWESPDWPTPPMGLQGELPDEKGWRLPPDWRELPGRPDEFGIPGGLDVFASSDGTKRPLPVDPLPDYAQFVAAWTLAGRRYALLDAASHRPDSGLDFSVRLD